MSVVAWWKCTRKTPMRRRSLSADQAAPGLGDGVVQLSQQQACFAHQIEPQ